MSSTHANTRPARCGGDCTQCGRPNSRYAGLCMGCYGRRRRRALAAGRWDNNRCADLAAAREHLSDLCAAGISIRQLAKLCGSDRMWLQRLARAATGYCDADKVAALLAIPLPAPADLPRIAATAGRVDAAGTRRRLRALAALGYTQAYLIGRLGMAPTMTYKLWDERRGGVSAVTARKAAALYDELSMTPPPDTYGSERVRREAARRGWAPPLAWCDDTIDDPGAQPEPWRRTYGARADWVGEVVERRRLGRSDADIAAALGVEVESMYRRFDRAHLPRDYGRPGVVA
jgi:hypothetical protein